MKKVILQYQKEIHYSSLHFERFIGVRYMDGEKGIVLYSEEGYGLLRQSEGIDLETAHKEIKLIDLLDRLKPEEEKNQEWFVFESSKEMFKWFSE